MKNHDRLELKQPFADDETAAYALFLNEMQAMRNDLVTLENGSVDILQLVNAHHRTGAINLIHYMGLRRRDLRPLQERLAELQEEIMWLAEAAHLPLIWATQVLEGLTKNGKSSRAEITDAAMGERAECVMLNKGPHILGSHPGVR